jgi:trehalose-6-phosphatase
MSALADAATRAEAELMGQPGLLLERKPVGLGLHYRGAPSDARRRSATHWPDRLLSGLPGYHAHRARWWWSCGPMGSARGNAVRR